MLPSRKSSFRQACNEYNERALPIHPRDAKNRAANASYVILSRIKTGHASNGVSNPLVSKLWQTAPDRCLLEKDPNTAEGWSFPHPPQYGKLRANGKSVSKTSAASSQKDIRAAAFILIRLVISLNL